MLATVNSLCNDIKNSDPETVVKTANNVETKSENEEHHNRNEKHLIGFSVNKPEGNAERNKENPIYKNDKSLSYLSIFLRNHTTNFD